MNHYLKYYITPALTPIFILSILLGGNWMWLGFGILVVIFIFGDSLLGNDIDQPGYELWLIFLSEDTTPSIQSSAKPL